MTSTRIIRTAAVVAVGAISAFGLAACGSTAGTDSGAPTSGEPVTIEYMHRLDNGTDMATVAEITERWNKDNPDIQVKTTNDMTTIKAMIAKFGAQCDDMSNGLVAGISSKDCGLEPVSSS